MAREKNGWIKLYSSVLEKDFSPVEFKIWIGLLIIANTLKSKDPGLIDLPLRQIAHRLRVSLGAVIKARNRFIAEERLRLVKIPSKTKPIMGLQILNFGLYQGKEFVSPSEQSKGKIVSPSVQKVHSIEQSVSPSEQSRIQNRPQRITKNNKEVYIVLFNLWNELRIITHKKLTGDVRRAIDSARKDYSQEEIEQALRNYAVIVKGAEYYFNHRWTLAEFLSRRHSNNIERFLDLEVAKANFKKEADRGTHRAGLGKIKPRSQYKDPEQHRQDYNQGQEVGA